MPVVRIDALCACDGCAKRFGVELDLASDLGENVISELGYYGFEAVVREKIRNGTAGYVWAVRGKSTVDRIFLDYQPTIQAELLLCDVCSKKCDDLPIEGDLTRAQVNTALGLPEETT